MTIQKSSSDISPIKSHTKWPFYVWLITTVSTPSFPEYELYLPPFRVVRPGLEIIWVVRTVLGSTEFYMGCETWTWSGDLS